MLDLADPPAADAADALAVALCCARRAAGPRGAGLAAGEAAGGPGPARTARSASGELVDLSRAFARVRRGSEDAALERLALARPVRRTPPAKVR